MRAILRHRAGSVRPEAAPRRGAKRLDRQAALAAKDHYTFDFLDLAKAHSERELERGVVNNLHCFLAKMGGEGTLEVALSV